MTSASNKRTTKISEKPANRRRRLKTEIRQCERKLKKLLNLYESDRERWTLDGKGNKIPRKLNKIQGIVPDSKRHKGSRSHIDKMKARLKELG